MPTAAILPRQLDHVGHHACLVLPAGRHMPLLGTVLAQYPVRTLLRDPKRLPHLVDTPPPAPRAQKFPFAAGKTAEAFGIRMVRANVPETARPSIGSYDKAIEYCRTRERP